MKVAANVVKRKVMWTNLELPCIVVTALYLISINGKKFCDSPQYLELGKTGTISCLFQEDFFGVLWYNTTEYTSTDPLVDYHGFLKSGKGYTSGDFDVDTNGSLIINRVSLEHERTFIVAYIYSEKDGPIFIPVEVVIFVYPFPAYPVIDGCDLSQNCVLEVAYEGSLTCSIYGIHPKVQLEWQTFSKNDAPVMSFSNHKQTINKNGEMFNVILTSSFILNDESRDRLAIECKVTSPKEVPFHFSSKIDLMFQDADVHPTEQPNKSSKWSSFVWSIAIVVSFLLLICLVSIGVIFRKKSVCNRRNGWTRQEEMNSMLTHDQPRGDRLSDLKELFLKQIKGTYQDWYDAVQPIPYIKDRLCCVDKVFVEGGIEFLESTKVEGRREIWKPLETYENLFNAPLVRSPRLILEGEPGYGKSTVTLQFAHDWCNLKVTSPLKDVQILILLQLRQLGGVPSIYKAIKRFILPRETTISETDIEQILRNSQSVVIILDGFDEYPDQDSTTITDVMAIIARQMFQDFEVVTTTRSSILPKKYPPLTKRIRLTGFDDKARRYYIRKAVVGDDNEGVRKIEGYIEDNPILSDLCQNPLLFVMFVHMTQESEQFRKLNSVTSFFRHTISCFHSHMRNKMDADNVRKYKKFQTDHRDLDKLVFEAFRRQKQSIDWGKDEMCRLVGQEFYDQYIRIGILIEEESIDIVDDPGTSNTEPVQYKKKVRFYHKLFCEWYAAHHLADYLQRNPTLDLCEFLRHLDPFDFQYLYRFACGINSESAEKIIDYLRSLEGGNKFAILCILEQTGKIDNIKEAIRQLCDEDVIISHYDTPLLQRSSIKLLEIAARNEIPVREIHLHNCFRSVDLSTPSIRTVSNMALTSKIPVKWLAIGLYNRAPTEDEVIDILQFALMCPSLELLGLHGSVPPHSFNVDATLATLKSRNVNVAWHMSKDDPRYILNLETGLWQNEENGRELTEAELDRMRSSFAEHLQGPELEAFHKSEIINVRQRRRENAKERKNDSNDDPGVIIPMRSRTGLCRR